MQLNNNTTALVLAVLGPIALWAIVLITRMVINMVNGKDSLDGIL